MQLISSHKPCPVSAETARRLRSVVKRLVIELASVEGAANRVDDYDLSAAAQNLDQCIDYLNAALARTANG